MLSLSNQDIVKFLSIVIISWTFINLYFLLLKKKKPLLNPFQMCSYEKFKSIIIYFNKKGK